MRQCTASKLGILLNFVPARAPHRRLCRVSSHSQAYRTRSTYKHSTRGRLMQLQSVLLSSILNTFNFTTTSMSTAASTLQEGGHADVQSSTSRPVYFLSHGGPNVMYDTSHPAHAHLQKIGREITASGVRTGHGNDTNKLQAVVVFSAHWQAREPGIIEINVAEKADLIYDFYGFPAHFYAEKFPNVGSEKVAARVKGLLEEAGIRTRAVKRGLDHGVWASFKTAFDPDRNPLNVPIVQVSLFRAEDAARHYELGRALSPLRDEGIQIIASGQAVHNLRDMMFSMGGDDDDDGTGLPYTNSFDAALNDAIVASSSPSFPSASPDQAPKHEGDPPATARRKGKMLDLLKRADLRQAHPTLEHLLPIYVGAGASRDNDSVERIFKYKEGGLSWAMFRFGKAVG